MSVAVRVGIVGGGLAGLAAAAALAGQGLQIELLESRPYLGGRASSFLDRTTGEPIDNCQHVSMGCCTNLLDFCRRTGIASGFRRYRTLHFFGPDGRRCDFRSTRWLPAPLHLAAGLYALKYLSLSDRIGIARAMLRLARTDVSREHREGSTIAQWLAEQKQSPRACESFWSVVLVSALSETLQRISLADARKVFVDGFMAHRQGYEIDVPCWPLGELYGTRLVRWLGEQGITLRLGARVRRITEAAGRVRGVELVSGERSEFDAVISSVPWQRCRELFGLPVGRIYDPAIAASENTSWPDCKSGLQDDLPEPLDEVGAASRAAPAAKSGSARRTYSEPFDQNRLPELAGLERFEAAPISSVHLWFDRPITDLPHAVLVGRLSQWVFHRPDVQGPETAAGSGDAIEAHYYQVVISASRALAGRDRDEIIATVCGELMDVWPAAREARLLYSRMVTEHAAVFAPLPGMDQVRPAQTTSIPNLFLAGDWTQTGWPATMEGAVRSGYLAAEALLARLGRPQRLTVPDLPRGWLARWLIG